MRWTAGAYQGFILVDAAFIKWAAEHTRDSSLRSTRSSKDACILYSSSSSSRANDIYSDIKLFQLIPAHIVNNPTTSPASPRSFSTKTWILDFSVHSLTTG